MYSLITLPIHHYSYEKYYKRHNEYVEKEKKQGEKYWGVPFEMLSEESKRTWENLWWWPPWEYNDIVGYLEIGMDSGDHMTADIYFKRKFFPRRHPSKGRIGKRRIKEFIYYQEVLKKPVRGEDNDAYFETFNKIIKETKSIIRKRNRHFKLFMPKYKMNCFNFSKAHNQLIEIRKVMRGKN